MDRISKWGLAKSSKNQFVLSFSASSRKSSLAPHPFLENIFDGI